MAMYYVSIHYGTNQCGYLGYHTETKELEVKLPEAEWETKVRQYLQETRVIKNATGLNTYDSMEVAPLSSLENLKLALTRMWEAIGVQVDWSRPVELD